MKSIFLVSLLFYVLNVSAQDISGKWTGFLDQTAAAQDKEGYKTLWEKGLWKKGTPTCYFEVELNQNGSEIKGTTFCTVYLKGDYNATFTLEGKFENNKLTYTTPKKLKENILKGYRSGFCFSKVELTYYEKDSIAFLEGKWEGWNKDKRACAPAFVKLKKKKIVDESKEENYATREVLIKEEFDIKGKDNEVVIEVWDDNREDGDSVSLKVNDQWVLTNVEILNEKKVIKVTLDKKENIIVIYAENLGDIPPNTAAINIKYNDKNKKVVLKSNMWTSEAIKINIE